MNTTSIEIGFPLVGTCSLPVGTSTYIPGTIQSKFLLPYRLKETVIENDTKKILIIYE